MQRAIDFHTHIVAPWVVERRHELSRSDPCFGILYADTRAKLATAEDLIRSMDEAEVSASVVLNIGWRDHELCVRTNDYLLDCGTRLADRIIPYCMANPALGERAVQEVERCATSGARGIGELRPDVQGYSLLDTELLTPFVGAMVDHDLALLVHASEPVGHQYPGKGTVLPDQPYGLATAFPHLTLICAHWGGGLPFYALMPEVGNNLSNVYFDTAATQYLYRPEVFESVVRLVGSSHILFGSDFPLIGQRRALDHVRKAGLGQDDESAVLAVTAAQLLRLEAQNE
jgi:uncharacterized protein